MRPSWLTWLCTSLSAGLPRWSFLVLLPLSLKLAGSRSATLNLAAALLSARGLHPCTGNCAAVCSRSGIGMFWTLLRVLIWVICASHGTWGRDSFLLNLDLLLKLRHVEEFSGCPHFIWDISYVELERQILRLFSTAITRSSCN